MITPKWQDFYASFFYRLSESEAATWEWELKDGPKKIRNFTPELLMNAIRRLAARKDRDGKTITAKLKDVQDEMFNILREGRKADVDALEKPICDDCHNTGFYCGVRLLFDSKDRKTIVGVCDQSGCGTEACQNATRATICYDLAVPCKCQTGHDMRQAKPGYKDGKAIGRLQDMIERNKRDRGRESVTKIEPVRIQPGASVAKALAEVADDWLPY
jgi:hypothetical protein